ncbi:MAG: ABC transporter permease, partial [Anaerolineae bacterium]|nr:ABC transporter permease [Anaerolineae bacterium]
MMARWWKFLLFAVMHSLRDMWRNRARTVFALVCVATGVAAVVALRTLALMVGDELTTNLAEVNRGDIRVYASSGVPELVERSGGQTIFTQEAVDVMEEWAAYEGVDMTFARFSVIVQMKPDHEGDVAASAPVLIAFVEPEHYPFYDTIMLEAPRGQGLRAALRVPDTVPDAEGPYPIVVSEMLTRETRLQLQVGDTLRLGASVTEFVVAGVAAAESESVLSLPQTALVDYAYLPYEALALLDEPVLPDQVFIKVPFGRDVRQVETSFIAYLQGSFDTDTDFSVELNRATVPELEEQNAETADIIDDMILVMGLSSLLIGGIGIVNTMLVIVSRRTLEIAVLKTLGLKAYRVTLLFLVEAVLLGLIGSVVGIVLGIAISYVIRDV